MPVSKFQSATKERLTVLLHGYNVEENVRPDWLVNPKTGRKLEIDLYLPDVKIGIEVQGVQHTKYTPRFHESEQDFQDQLERDDFKRAICQQRGVFLYEVYRVDDIDGFIEAAKAHCPEMAFELYKKWASMKALSYYAARLYEYSHQKRRVRKPEQVRSVANKIRHICTKYGIAPESIEPDFTIKKIEMSFIGMPIVKMSQPRNGYTKDEYVAVKSKEGNVLTCIRNKVLDGQQTLQFDLTTGEQIGKADGVLGWTVDPAVS